MGQFTRLSDDTLRAILTRFGVDPLSIDPVEGGSVNTYLRVTDRSKTYYLRIDERGDPEAVRHELSLLARITGVSVPRALSTVDGAAFASAGEKPALLFTELPGRSVSKHLLTGSHLAAVGASIAALHRADPSGLAPHRFHPRALFEAHYLPMRELVRRERPAAAAALDEVFCEGWRPYEFAALPRAIVHADLFADNLHFDDEGRCGVLDFEAAGEGPRLLDLAVAAHALCFDPGSGRFDLRRVDALLRAYAARHVLTDDERAAWPALLRFGAARFLFTRVRDFDLAPGAAEQPDRRDHREFLGALGATPALAARLPRE